MAASVPFTPEHVALSRQIQAEMEAVQWYDRERLAAYQWQVLRPLLEHARSHVPYYADRLQGLDFARLSTLGRDGLLELPLLSRDDVRASEVEIVANELPEWQGESDTTETTGSTGRPVRVRYTRWMSLWDMASDRRDHYWHNRDLSKPLVTIRSAGRKSQRAKQWSIATGMLHRTGPAYYVPIRRPFDEQVDVLRQVNAAYLLTFPTNLEPLARYCIDHGLRVESLIEARTISEMLPPGLRDLVKQAWGVPMTDNYSCKELGSMALQCPEHLHYHEAAEQVVVEVLREDDTPCEPGEVGRVVVTGLRGWATPLIRYDIGDYAEVGEPCSCGRGLPVLTRIVGRARNRIRLPDGSRVWPVTGYDASAQTKQIRQLQFIQNQIDRILVKIVATESLTDQDIERLTKKWRRGFHESFEFDIEYVDDIPRNKGDKFEEVICNV